MAKSFSVVLEKRIRKGLMTVVSICKILTTYAVRSRDVDTNPLLMILVAGEIAASVPGISHDSFCRFIQEVLRQFCAVLFYFNQPDTPHYPFGFRCSLLKTITIDYASVWWGPVLGSFHHTTPYHRQDVLIP